MERATGGHHTPRMTSPAQLVLGSTSKGRRWLLGFLVDAFRCAAPEVDERSSGEPPRQLVERLALAKARAVQQRLEPACAVLGGDTVMVCDGRTLGKPHDADTAAEMLQMLSGRKHSVLSGVALVHGDWQATRVSETHITLHPLDKAQIRAYCALGEGLDKAGGYALQGKGAAFVRSLAGGVSGALGLPLADTRALLSACNDS